jgi:protein-S-isoprenylcysteine O-methyltransferase Ste14
MRKMNSRSGKASVVKELIFYILGALLIIGFIALYFPRFFGISMVPPAIRFLVNLRFPDFINIGFLPSAIRYFLYSNWATICAITVNAGIFILFLVFLPYRTKVNWRSKSAFSAFILALFAEMFGVPLLLYILSPIMHIGYYDKHAGGWTNNPLIFGWSGAVIGAWLTLFGMIIVVIGWHQIHRAQGLVTTGLYKTIRHPQYTGFFLVMTGWLLQWETTLTLIMYPFLLLMYFLLARSEEAQLKKEFGIEYESYCQRTSRFLPIRLDVFKKRKTPDTGSS